MNNSLMKKWGLLLGTVSIISQIGPAFAEDSLKDIKTHWSKTYVDRLYKEGYVVGSNGYFNPNQALKTEDFLIMVLKTVDPSSKDLKATEGQKYYQPFLERALAVGLIKDPYDEVPQYVERMMPRELAVQVIDRALTMIGENVTADHGLEYKFKDYAIINDVNKEAVLKAYQLGIIKGSNGNFEPKNPLTRAEAAVLVSKLMDKSLRDKLVFGTNPKTYDQVAEWYLKTYEAMIPYRTPVIERKADGSINTGDHDFLEIRKWWSDQEFEDKMIANISTPVPFDFSSGMAGSVKKDLNYVQGTFFVHNGDIAFVNKDGYKDKKAYRMYDKDFANYSRLVYDLTKYATQYASEKGKYAYVLADGSRVVIALLENGDPNSPIFGLTLYQDMTIAKNIEDTTFKPMIRFDLGKMGWKNNEVLIRQMAHRLYGKTKGEKAFQYMKSNLSQRTHETVGHFEKQYDGIWYQLADYKDFQPVWITSIK